MSRKNTAAAAATEPAAQVVESTDEAQTQAADAGITDATEAEQREGVVTTDATEAAESYAAVWNVKAGGKWHQPGDAIAAELVTPELLASGAVTMKG